MDPFDVWEKFFIGFSIFWTVPLLPICFLKSTYKGFLLDGIKGLVLMHNFLKACCQSMILAPIKSAKLFIQNDP